MILIFPAVLSGGVTIICVSELTEYVEFELPNFTELAPVKLAPIIVTLVPPEGVPYAGDTDVIPGELMYVNLSPAPTALVPPAAVTVISTCPALPAGETAMS